MSNKHNRLMKRKEINRAVSLGQLPEAVIPEISSDRFVEASELQSGDTIKLSPRHSKKYWIREITVIDGRCTGLRHLHGQIKITFWSCSSIIVPADRKFFRIHSPKTISHG